MDSGEEAICEEYVSSLEDLTFNSKPLINVLTMLAEENSRYASSITRLIESRIYQVPQQIKLPSLYLLDSIIKNVGGDYLHLVAQIMEKAFVAVFEKADEKVRRDLYKLRHTWSQYFPAKMLYDLDVAVNKLDPGWPIPSAPPPSPSIHINPKFLKKTENSSGVASITGDISTPQEHQVLVDHQNRLSELERLQEEQLKLTEQEIQEHQMKRDLLLKKQQQERQLLIQQQQHQILQLRLQPDELELGNEPPNLEAHLPVSTKAETTNSVQDMGISRDPRLRRNEQLPNVILQSQLKTMEQSPVVMPESRPLIAQEMESVENANLMPVSANRENLNASQNHQSALTLDGPSIHENMELNHLASHGGLETDHGRNRTPERLQHNVRAENPTDHVGRFEPRIHHDSSPLREVTSGPKFDEGHRRQKLGQQSRRRHNSPPFRDEINELHESNRAGIGRRKGVRGRRRRRSMEGLREKEKAARGRGYNVEGRKRIREPGNDRFPISHEKRGGKRINWSDHMDDGLDRGERWNSERDFRRISGRSFGDKWSRDHMEFSREREDVVPGPQRSENRNSPVPFESRFPGHDGPVHLQENFVREGSPVLLEPRLMEIDRARRDNLGQFDNPRFVGREMPPNHQSLMREDNHWQHEPELFGEQGPDHPLPPFHEDLHERPHSDEPLLKKPRPLLSDVEISALRGRPGGSPSHGTMGPSIPHEGLRNHPPERSPHEPMDLYPSHPDHHFPPRKEALLLHGPPEQSFHRDPMAPHRPAEFRSHSPSIEIHKEWSPGFEIPRELMLDRQTEIMRQAERRLQSGDLTEEQHHELVDKLQQLYELQRHPGLAVYQQEGMHPQHVDHRPAHPSQPRLEERPHRPGGLVNMECPPMGHGRPRIEGPPEHMIPLGGPTPVEPQPVMGPGGPYHNEDLAQPPLEQNRPLPLEGPSTRSAGPLDSGHRLDRSKDPHPVHVGQYNEHRRTPRKHESSAGLLPVPSSPPRQSKGPDSPPHTPNTMMEKKAVDDLFRRLMQVGIIKVTPEPVNGSPQHVPSPGPPLQPAPESQNLLPLPPPVPNLQVTPSQQLQEDLTIPVIQLVPEELKRRHVGVIKTLYEGLQCSSCGLRFPGEAATIYREHLDWHFRKNRREKDGKRIAHRQWYFVVKDWLAYEEISDPEERARSSFFDVNLSAVDSPDPSIRKESGETSCPVLSGDSETEAVCGICFEKFEQFWEETNEEWHYKAAVRVDGKTYHSLCYQDAKENQLNAYKEDEDEEQGSLNDSVEAHAEEKSLEKQAEIRDDGKDVETEVVTTSKQEQEIDKDSHVVGDQKTVKSNAMTSLESSDNVVNRSGDKSRNSVNTVDNKESETKGDE